MIEIVIIKIIGLAIFINAVILVLFKILDPYDKKGIILHRIILLVYGVILLAATLFCFFILPD